jgi:hypothetical protein
MTDVDDIGARREISAAADESELATPAVRVVRSVDELHNLPTETLLTWTDLHERVAAVLFVDEDEVWISHTGPDHWSTSIDHVRYPAQAFIW